MAGPVLNMSEKIEDRRAPESAGEHRRLAGEHRRAPESPGSTHRRALGAPWEHPPEKELVLD